MPVLKIHDLLLPCVPFRSTWRCEVQLSAAVSPELSAAVSPGLGYKLSHALSRHTAARVSSCTDECELSLLWPHSVIGAKVCRSCWTVEVATSASAMRCSASECVERRWLLHPPHESGHMERTKAPDVPVHSPVLFQLAQRSEASLHSEPLTVAAVVTGTERRVAAVVQTPQLLAQLSAIHDAALFLHSPLAAHVAHEGFLSAQSATVDRPVGTTGHNPLVHRSVVTGLPIDEHIDSRTGKPLEPVQVTARYLRPVPHVAEQAPHGFSAQYAVASAGAMHSTAHRPGIEHVQADEHCCWIHVAVAPMHSPLLAHVWHCELTSTHATGMGAPVGGM